MASRLVDMGFRGHVLKLSAAGIVIQNVLRPRQPAGTAHHWYALPHARSVFAGVWSGRQIKINVICDHQVEHSIPTVIYKSAPGTHRFAGTRNPPLVAHV